MLAAAHAWARELRARDVRVHRVGVFGSYARGDAGVGSDLDLAVVVSDGWGASLLDVTKLPIPAEVVVFEETRWKEAALAPTGIARTIAREALWLDD